MRSTAIFAQIKRSLPPRGRCRTNVRRKEYACIINFNIFMPKNSFRHCFAMPPPSRGRLGYTLHLCRGDLRAPAGERSSPLPDDKKNVSVSQKTAGASPRPTAKLIILCFLLLFGTILSKSLHLEGKVSTRASIASDAVDG